MHTKNYKAFVHDTQQSKSNNNQQNFDKKPVLVYVVFYGFGIGVALANFMASSYYSSCCFFNCCSFASLPNSSSTTHFSLSFSHSILNGHNGISLHKAGSSSKICAKFDKFQGETPLDSLEVEAVTPSTLPAQPQIVQEEVEEDDRFCFL